MVEAITILPALLIIGALGGILAGLLGVGGGIVLVPAFLIAFEAMGYSSPQLMQVCLATSLATIVVTSLRSVSSHHKKGAVDWHILKSWAGGLFIGALIGVFVATRLRSNTLILLFGAVGICIGFYMAFGKPSWKFRDAMPDAFSFIVSPIIAFLSVLMGIGGGNLGVPLMTLFGGDIHRAIATASGFGAIIAIPSALAFLFTATPEGRIPPYTVGFVNLPAFFIVICMTLITTPLGVKLAHAMNPKPLKRVFAGFLILVAGRMLFSGLS